MGNDHSFGAKVKGKNLHGSVSSGPGDVVIEIPNEIKDRPRSRRFIRSAASEYNHETAIRKSLRDWQTTERQLREENQRMKVKLTHIEEEKKRLEDQRNRMLETFQNLHTELSDTKNAYRIASDQAVFYRGEKDRLQRMFNNYRENKEAQLEALRKRVSDRRNDDHDRTSCLGESLPTSPGICSSKQSLFGSSASLNPWGSAYTVPSEDGNDCQSEMDYLFNLSSSNAGAAMVPYSALSSCPSITVCLLTDFDSATKFLMDRFSVTYIPALETMIESRNRSFDLRILRTTDPYSNSLQQLSSETLILVVFCSDILSPELKDRIRKLYLDNEQALLAVFCLTAQLKTDCVEFWDEILRNPGTRFCRNTQGEELCLRSVSQEVEHYFKTEFQSDFDPETEPSQGEYEAYWRSRSMLTGQQFCPFVSNSYQRELFEYLSKTPDECWLDRPALAETLKNHLHSPGPLAPLLITGSEGAGVSSSLAHWLKEMEQIMAGSLFCLSHFVTHSGSLTADPYLMLKRYCSLLKMVVDSPLVGGRKEKNWIDSEDLKKDFIQLLEQAAMKFSNGVLIVIDGLDSMIKALETSSEALSWLLSPLPMDCRVIVTAHSSNFLTEWKSWPTFHLDACIAPEAMNLLENIFRKEKDFASLIAAQLALPILRTPESLVALGTFLYRTEPDRRETELHDILSNLQTSSGLLYELLQRAPALFPNFTFEEQQCVWKVLGFLSCCRDGLSRRELMQVVQSLDQRLWDKLWPELQSFCGGIVIDMAGLYRIKSEQWRAAVSTLVEPSVLQSELYQFWLNHRISWRRVDEVLYLSAKVHESILKSDFLQAPILLSLVSRGHNAQLLNHWYQCTKGSGATLLIEELCDTLSTVDSSIDVASCYLALGVLCLDLSLGHEMALKMLQRASEIFQSHIGGDDPVIALVSHYMAGCYSQNGNARIAEELHKKAIAIYGATLGGTHPVVELEIVSLIQLCKSANKIRSAEIHERKLTELRAKRDRSSKSNKNLQILERKRLKLVEAPETVRTLNQLAMMRFYYADFDTAADLFSQALDMKSKLLGGTGDCMEFSRELQNLAAVSARKKDWNTAEQCYRRLLDIRERALGSNDRSTISAVRSLVQTLHRQEKPTDLEPLLRRLLDRAEQLNEHGQIVVYLSQLSALHLNQGEHDKAEPLLEQALKIAEVNLSPTHPAATAVRKVYAKLHLDAGNFDQAVRFYMQSLHRPQPPSVDSKPPALCIQPATPNPQSQEIFVLDPPPPGRNRKTSSH